jgi:hypothetical protein
LHLRATGYVLDVPSSASNLPRPAPEDRDVVPPHDPFAAPDAEDEADTRERVLDDLETPGDGDEARVREEFGLSEDE